jgi:hypothetical protein
MAHGRMASKLKRRIPVIFSGVGASAGSSSVASVGVANIPPSWTDTLGDSFSVTAGVPFSYTFTAYDPNPGDLIDFIQNSISAGLTVTENDQSGLYRTITIASPGYPGGTGLAVGTYTASLDIDEIPTAEADWLLRSGQDPNNPQPGVVWAHDFRDETEVKQFRVSDVVTPFATTHTGNDPNNLGINTVDWEASAGIGSSGVLLTSAPNGFTGWPSGTWYQSVNSATGYVNFPIGTTYTSTGTLTGTYTFPGGSTYSYSRASGDPAPTNTRAYFRGEKLKYEGRVSAGGWIRPFSPLPAAQNGRSVADPAANGTVTLRSWNSASTSQTNSFTYGFYGHSDYHSGDTWDGTEFWLQFRVKISSGRHATRTDVSGGTGTNAVGGLEYPPSGKLFFVEKIGGGSQEIIGISGGGTDARYFYQTYPARMYTEYGTSMDYPFTGTQSVQPGGEYASTCTVGGVTTTANTCWEWPENEWVTVLLHVKPGHQNTGSLTTRTNTDSTIEMKVARAGAPTWTTVYSVTTFPLAFESPFGFQNFALNCYMNNFPAFAGFQQRFTQIVFSKAAIPLPQA